MFDNVNREIRRGNKTIAQKDKFSNEVVPLLQTIKLNPNYLGKWITTQHRIG